MSHRAFIGIHRLLQLNKGNKGAEIEINIMDRQCTGRRVATQEELTAELDTWTSERHEQKGTRQWKFTRQIADQKLAKHYIL